MPATMIPMRRSMMALANTPAVRVAPTNLRTTTTAQPPWMMAVATPSRDAQALKLATLTPMPTRMMDLVTSYLVWPRAARFWKHATTMKKHKSTMEHVSSQGKEETVTGIAWRTPTETTCVMATRFPDARPQQP